jgi:hypothetical protein
VDQIYLIHQFWSSTVLLIIKLSGVFSSRGQSCRVQGCGSGLGSPLARGACCAGRSGHGLCRRGGTCSEALFFVTLYCRSWGQWTAATKPYLTRYSTIDAEWRSQGVFSNKKIYFRLYRLVCPSDFFGHLMHCWWIVVLGHIARLFNATILPSNKLSVGTLPHRPAFI